MQTGPTRYPGLRENLTKKFKDHPQHAFAVTDLCKSFQGITNSNLSYHCKQMVKHGVLTVPKPGFYQLNATKPKSSEQIRAEVAAQPSRVVQSQESFQHGKENGIKPVDTLWTKLLTKQLDSILARMDSELPAKALFMVADRDALTEMLNLAISRRPMLPNTVEV
jgi:hypothetical protein